mgnify:CR=1 FL=1
MRTPPQRSDEWPTLAATATPEQIDAALAAGADVDATDTVGRTAILIAAKAGRLDVVRHLIAAGACLASFATPELPQHADVLTASGMPVPGIVELHRLLRQRLPDYDPARHLGGVFYLFLRGMPEGGVFHATPSVALVQDLDRLFEGGADAQ